MTAPRFICRNTKKALAERGPSIHDGRGGYTHHPIMVSESLRSHGRSPAILRSQFEFNLYASLIALDVGCSCAAPDGRATVQDGR